MNERLIEETRNNWLECEHRGAICGVGKDGNIRYALGDMESLRFLRSAGKPFQAIPVVKSGTLEHYGLTDRELALMMSSHRGESFHMETMHAIMERSGLIQSELVCNPSLPLHEPTKETWLREGGDRERRFHNCAGKHFGVLSWCQHAGYDKASYTDPDHPAQQEITAIICELSGVTVEEMGVGTDGCGFPVYALPLPAIGQAYLHLACPEFIKDTATRQAVQRIRDAMIKYPLLVGGTGRLDSVLMEDTNIVAKGGFKGIFGFALREEQLGFAIKIADGSDEECAYVITSILEQMGYKTTDTIQRLKEAFPSAIINDQGVVVGDRRAVFQFNL
ncbi:asparaginase [Paenibacillus sp. UMB4589-SE434]|uniref:asparaginase n=1 Tax=Paenibacillus sp. UMB4589-SE434 TaxID=3046314 RepID=UPI0025501999|nr:asparaginase [Paenibacillus sp. UMB4589-SE434]MDK8183179.1 asparaginase [Paenibacillus sp. UMB4589-SE434]